MALSGCRADAADGGAVCHVLQVDACRILLDCGAPFSLDPVAFRKLGSIAKHIDAVLLTHADIAHLGAYAYAHAKLGLTCPAYATIPVHELGRLAVREALHARRATEDFTLFTHEDVNTAFDNITALRYSQPFSLSGKGKGVTITAFRAGHSLGGTIWKLKKGADEIIYAIDYNHQIDRTTLNAKELERPTLLITDAYNSLYNYLPSQSKRQPRDAAFFENIRATLYSGGNVLIPVSSTTRSLELTFLLEDFWTKSPDCAQKFPVIYFLSPQSPRIIHTAKRTLEWMGSGIAKLLTQQERRIPFDFTYVKHVQTIAEIDESKPIPKVIIAGGASLEPGTPARDVFLAWSRGAANLVLLPERGDPGTLARRLHDAWVGTGSELATALPAFRVTEPGETRRVPLEGEELAAHLRAEDARREAAAAAAELARLAAMEEHDSDMSDEEDGGAGGGTAARRDVSTSAAGVTAAVAAFGNAFDIYVKDSQRAGGFFKQSQSYRMFPVSNPRVWVDDYGEAVDPMLFANSDSAAMEGVSEELPQVQMEDTQDLQDTIPSKYISFPLDYEINCKVIFIDFEGRSDGKSVKNILTQVAPRKLLLVHGSDEATSDLEKHCEENTSLTNDVFAPHNNEWINVSAASDMFEINLTDALVSSLVMSKINDYELAYVSGFIKNDKQELTQPIEGSGSSMMVDGEGDGDVPQASATNATVPTLDILPLELGKRHTPVIVGDVKLSEFRKVLVSKGFETQFVAGVLVVNRTIMIRKSRQQQGRLMLEGSLSADYYACRKLLYAEHAVL
ncbi:cleavage and polyadenylation specificity factor subunit 2 [Entophlyctis luteolus]|nr:cleavage and polyadenylation specificity factor subunit 2 [Entophlyctis luteolus]